MRKRFIAASGAAVAALSFAALEASAHHGWAGQGTEQFQVSGTVSKAVSLAGPHASMQIEDEKGQVWDITLAPPARTDRAGLQEDSIPLGAKVTITGNRNLDPNRYEVKTVRVSHDGKNYDVYPDRL